MRFGVTLLVQFWPSTQPSNPAITNWRPQRPQSSALLPIPAHLSLFKSSLPPCPPEGSRMSSHQTTREEWQRWFSLRAQRQRRLVFWSFDWQPFWACCCGQCSSPSLVWPWQGHLCLDSTLLPPFCPPPFPISTHTQLLFPVRFIRFDTPHPPAIVRTRKGRMGLFVGIGLVVFVRECGSKLRATSASTIHLL